MSNKYLLSVDPGLSTGIAFLSYTDDTPAELVKAWQFTGGVTGILKWHRVHVFGGGMSGTETFNVDPYADGSTGVNMLGHDGLDWKYSVEVIAEKFTARNTKGFSYTTSSLEPLRCEGALITLDMLPDYTPKEKQWRDPALQYIVGGADLADKKKRQHAFLKDTGYYVTNKDFKGSPAKDGADDARSAIAHGLAYLVREKHHKPTFQLMKEWSDENS